MDSQLPKKRQLPKLMACMTKTSLENLRNRALFSLEALDAKGIRRRKRPLHQCLILELRESGFFESSDYLQDLIYDNIQLVKNDDIGIVVDLRKREDYLEHICAGLIQAEKYRDKGDTKKECLELLVLAIHYAEKGKGILWLAEKFFLASIAVSSQYLIDGGRQKGCCKYHYAKFLLDKFPGADPEEPFVILTEVRDSAIGKDWPLYEAVEGEEIVSSEMLFSATAIQLHRVLVNKARLCRTKEVAKSETLARLAERRARDADDVPKTAEAIIEIGISQLMMNNLNNAQKTFEKAYRIHTESNNNEGLCETKMHMAAVMQRLGEYEKATKLLTEMGAMAMEHNLRRQLGQALHLLGELHLRSERPELGTQHLTEAFHCFLGDSCLSDAESKRQAETEKKSGADIDVIFVEETKGIVYEVEAEQSRLMMSISAGQELMASYFNLIRESRKCSISKIKIIEWKLSKSGWWVERHHHDLLPCLCPIHQRSPLDILRIQLIQRSTALSQSEIDTSLGRTGVIEDIRKLRSSFGSVEGNNENKFN
ncbi:uncharacterized protein LOC123715073 [Pieris brassicae]|uniref:Tetratricopeptide repeat protein 29 n=1 Tax=Pieris brassicae TaxID=7116 RepID=A0A9P0TJA0_PIEBR|nr:uncharacterized protein LOC123715073 [Pieris brassicae]CAH4033248.1 unnamed protein product [Pieris brassicae]